MGKRLDKIKGKKEELQDKAISTAGRKFFCGSCGHEWRGLKDSKCPNCGN